MKSTQVTKPINSLEFIKEAHAMYSPHLEAQDAFASYSIHLCTYGISVSFHGLQTNQ